MVKTCLQCKGEFKTYNRRVNHCSRECAIDAIRKTESLTCDHCGGTFERAPGRTRSGVTATFCSRECHAQAKKAAARRVVCPVCSKEFSHPSKKTCSRACANRAARKNATARCRHCGERFATFPSELEKGRKYCSTECATLAMVGENSAHWRGGACLQKGRYWEKIRRMVLDRDKGCLNCGAERSPSGRTLDVHHIDPRRNYRNQDAANILGNLVALCAPCHSRLEMAITHGRVPSLPKRLAALASVPPSTDP